MYLVLIPGHSRDARVRGNAYISCFYCNAHAHASVELLLISLRFERAWCVSVSVIKLLPQDSEHASRLRTRTTLTHVRSEVKLTVAHTADEVRLLLTATTAAYYVVYLPDFVR